MKPTEYTAEYKKFGLVMIRIHGHKCGECGAILNAGPNWQPKCCEECGTKVDWSDVVWIPDEELE